MAASALRLLAVAPSLRSSAAAQRERLGASRATTEASRARKERREHTRGVLAATVHSRALGNAGMEKSELTGSIDRHHLDAELRGMPNQVGKIAAVLH
jgi:hypothetical protein